MIEHIDVSGGTYAGGPIYLSAAVDACTWDGSACTGAASSWAVFSLSGSTNADGSLTWFCIPTYPGENYTPHGPNSIPEPYLPLESRLY